MLSLGRAAKAAFFGASGLVAAMALTAAPTPALAVSADCSTLAINENLPTGDFATTTYTFEPGEKVTFNVVVPTGASVEILFFGESRTFTNNGSVTFTVPNTGPTVTGSFIFRVNAGVGQTVGITADCEGADNGGGNAGIDANAAANVIDDAAESALPGGNSGDIADEFGLSDIFLDPALVLRQVLQNSLELVELRRQLLLENERLIDEVLDLEDQLIRAGPVGPALEARRDALQEVSDRRGELAEANNALQDALNQLSESVGSTGGVSSVPDIAALEQAVFDAEAASRDAFDQYLEASEEVGRIQRETENGPPNAEQQRIQDRIEQLNARSEQISNQIAAIDQIRATPISAPGSNQFQSTGRPILPSDVPNPLRITQSGLSGRFDLATWRRQQAARRVASAFDEARVSSTGPVYGVPGLIGDPRFNAWIKGSVTFHHVDADNRDEDGYTAAVAGGVSYRFAPRVEAGLIGRFAHTERDGRLAETEVDIWSAGAFVQGLAGGGVVLRGIAVASFGDGETVLDPAATRPTGDFDVTAYQAQVTASRRFTSGRWWIEPNASATITHMIRDGFTASDGTVVPETESTRFTAAIGPTVGTDILLDGGAVLAPFLGANLFVTAVDEPDRVTPVDSADSAVGATAKGGFSLRFANAWSLSLDGRVTVYSEDSVDTGVAGRLRVPLGRP